MKVNEFAVLAECVDRGIAAGWNNGHEAGMSPAAIQDQIAREVIDAICEMFVFADAYDDE